MTRLRIRAPTPCRSQDAISASNQAFAVLGYSSLTSQKDPPVVYLLHRKASTGRKQSHTLLAEENPRRYQVPLLTRHFQRKQPRIRFGEGRHRILPHSRYGPEKSFP